MVTTVDTSVHTDAVLTALALTGRPVGDAIAPEGSLPYVVVYPQSGTRNGSIADPDADASLVYQFTCVGWDRTGAQWMADRVAEAIRSITVEGRAVIRVQLLTDTHMARDDDVDPPVFYATPMYRIWTTPIT